MNGKFVVFILTVLSSSVFFGWSVISFLQNRFEESIAAGIISVAVISISKFINKS